MSYYGRGDYYRGSNYGDYYRGDPGLLSGLGKLIKGAAGATLGALPGGQILTAGGKLLAGAVGGARGKAITRIPVTLPTPGEFIGSFGAGLRAKHPSLPVPDQPLPMLGLPSQPYGGTTYGGLPMRGPLAGMAYGFGRSRRRMNVTNIRALRRALRRAEGFSKLARRFVKIRSAFRRKPLKRTKRR